MKKKIIQLDYIFSNVIHVQRKMKKSVSKLNKKILHMNSKIMIIYI